MFVKGRVMIENTIDYNGIQPQRKIILIATNKMDKAVLASVIFHTIIEPNRI
jgi:hypothetical protein